MSNAVERNLYFTMEMAITVISLLGGTYALDQLPAAILYNEYFFWAALTLLLFYFAIQRLEAAGAYLSPEVRA